GARGPAAERGVNAGRCHADAAPRDVRGTLPRPPLPEPMRVGPWRPAQSVASSLRSGIAVAERSPWGSGQGCASDDAGGGEAADHRGPPLGDGDRPLVSRDLQHAGAGGAAGGGGDSPSPLVPPPAPRVCRDRPFPPPP